MCIESGIFSRHRRAMAASAVFLAALAAGTACRDAPRPAAGKETAQTPPPAAPPPPRSTPVPLPEPFTTTSGVRVTMLSHGTGRLAGEEEQVTFLATVRLADGTVISDVTSAGAPLVAIPSQVVPRGLGEALTVLPRGARARLEIPPGPAFSQANAPAGVPAEMALRAEIELLSIDPAPVPSPTP